MILAILFSCRFRWTVNLALQTANEFFKSPSSFDASDLAQVFLVYLVLSYRIHTSCMHYTSKISISLMPYSIIIILSIYYTFEFKMP